MPLFIYVLPLVPVGGIVYFALSKHSTPRVRRLAIVVLIILGLVLLGSLGIILTGQKADAKFSPGLSAEPPDTVAPQSDYLFLGLFLLLFLGGIVYLIVRELRRNQQ